MFQFLQRLFGGSEPADRGPSLPLELARRGWKPYRFPQSSIVVLLPERIAAAFGPDGALYASTNDGELLFSATLHGGFDEDRAQALAFVSQLAQTKGLTTQDLGTYRYFFDPTEEELNATTDRFWVVGIPGAVVIISILCDGVTPVTAALGEVRDQIPHLVGELL